MAVAYDKPLPQFNPGGGSMTPGKVHLVLGTDQPRANERFFQALISTWNDSHHQHLHTEDMTETYYNEGGITMAATNVVAVAPRHSCSHNSPLL